MLWNYFACHFAKVLSVLWFAGAILMLTTIPACIYKILSALWEPDEQEQAVIEKCEARGSPDLRRNE
jgi:NADH:ubiquinone oxidoreductase subunit 6 (subunit J)